MAKIIGEVEFQYKKEFKREVVQEYQLKVKNGKQVKVLRDVYKDIELTDTRNAIKDAQKEAVKQGFVDATLEKVTDNEYLFRFYNAKDQPRTEKEKKDAKKSK